jgi:hypothetical protein
MFNDRKELTHEAVHPQDVIHGLRRRRRARRARSIAGGGGDGRPRQADVDDRRQLSLTPIGEPCLQRRGVWAGVG